MRPATSVAWWSVDLDLDLDLYLYLYRYPCPSARPFSDRDFFFTGRFFAVGTGHGVS